MDELMKLIEEAAKPYFIGASGCHDWTHVERVRVQALRLARQEGADLAVVEAAAFLHDIGRKAEMDSKGAECHAVAGAAEARSVLGRLGADSPFIDAVAHCIEAHRFRNDLAPATLEAKVLFDADKLDSIGVIGMARAFLFAGSAGSGTLYSGREGELAANPAALHNLSYTDDDSAILEYEVKLKKVKDRMLTASGRATAEGRHQAMVAMVDRFWGEVLGHF
jgi:uncharacterized protein